MSIQFTQYLRPHGEKTTVSVDRSPEVESKANALKIKGCKFEIEVLMDGKVSMTVEHPQHEMPFAMELSSNGPEVLEKVDRMTTTAYDHAVSIGMLR